MRLPIQIESVGRKSFKSIKTSCVENVKAVDLEFGLENVEAFILIYGSVLPTVMFYTHHLSAYALFIQENQLMVRKLTVLYRRETLEELQSVLFVELLSLL